MSSLFNVREVIRGMNPLMLFVDVLIGFAAVLAIITAILMLPGIVFGLLPEALDMQVWWLKDMAFAVVDNILPLWMALLLGLAVCVDLVLDLFIFIANVIMSLIDPPTYNFIGVQTGGWRNIPFNPLSGLIQQLYLFYQQMRAVA